MAEYRLSPKAETDMEGIWLYSLNAWGLRQAEAYTDTLVHAFSMLAQSPGLGQDCSHIRRGYRRYRVNKHWIYFKRAMFGVNIMRILHERMRQEDHL